MEQIHFHVGAKFGPQKLMSATKPKREYSKFGITFYLQSARLTVMNDECCEVSKFFGLLFRLSILRVGMSEGYRDVGM